MMRRTIARTIVLAALAAGAAWGQLTVSCSTAAGPVEVNVFYTANCTVALLPVPGVPPYSWQIGPTSASLPAGLTLTVSVDTLTATVSGMPTNPGPYSYEVQVTDFTLQTGFAAFGGTVAPALAVTTTGLPNGVFGVSYGATLQASGGILSSYTWSISSGSLPAGLTLDPPSGTISGIPQATGPFAFTVTVTDSAP
ncbi:MAG: Ig domain-containing protein, partial [Bryobacteraceae bacterium]